MNKDELYKRVVLAFHSLTENYNITEYKGKVCVQFEDVSSEYISYEELFEDEEIKEGIEIDLEDWSIHKCLYDSNGEWSYPVTVDDIMELQNLGISFDFEGIELEQNHNEPDICDD